MRKWEENHHRIDKEVALSCTNFGEEQITEEMEQESKITRLGEIVEDLRRKWHRDGRTCKTKYTPQGIEETREATIEAVKKIEEAEAICAKVVDQVSQNWEALMDDEQLHKIANELTTFEENII